MTDFIQINTTSDKKETLQRIAQQLVEQKLAACVQIGGPVESVYSWEGKLESSDEWTCSIKTTEENMIKTEETIRALHHYEVPQVTVVPIVAGSQSYLDWMSKQTSCQKSG